MKVLFLDPRVALDSPQLPRTVPLLAFVQLLADSLAAKLIAELGSAKRTELDRVPTDQGGSEVRNSVTADRDQSDDEQVPPLLAEAAVVVQGGERVIIVSDFNERAGVVAQFVRDTLRELDVQAFTLLADPQDVLTSVRGANNAAVLAYYDLAGVYTPERVSKELFVLQADQEATGSDSAEVMSTSTAKQLHDAIKAAEDYVDPEEVYEDED